MIIYGYAKGYHYTGDGTLMIRVRVPSIHGPYEQISYRGHQVRNYVRDDDLPYYASLLLPHLPNEGEVVALTAVNESATDFIVIGLTGGSYTSGKTNLNK